MKRDKHGTPELSVVIPTLDEATTIGELLQALAVDDSIEILVVDGGSTDGTPQIAARAGARVLHSPRGRGRQLAEGARVARGRSLWFLHADSRPPHHAAQLILAALRDPEVAGGSFSIRFSGASFAARLFTWIYPRLLVLGLRYGDASIFVRRETYLQVGGFRRHPLFEDVDLIARLRRVGRWLTLREELVVSSRRFEHRPLLNVALWCGLQGLYWLRVPPTVLARLYAPIRRANAATRTDA